MARPTEAPINVLEILDGIEFPTSKIDLIDYAYDQDASEEAVEILRALPDDVSFNHMNDVRRNLGRIEDLPDDQQWGSASSEEIPNNPDRV